MSFLQFETSAEFRRCIVQVPSLLHQWMVFKPTGCFALDFRECKSFGSHMCLGNNPDKDSHSLRVSCGLEPNLSLSALKETLCCVCLVHVFVLWESMLKQNIKFTKSRVVKLRMLGQYSFQCIIPWCII